MFLIKQSVQNSRGDVLRDDSCRVDMLSASTAGPRLKRSWLNKITAELMKSMVNGGLGTKTTIVKFMNGGFPY